MTHHIAYALATWALCNLLLVLLVWDHRRHEEIPS